MHTCFNNSPHNFNERTLTINLLSAVDFPLISSWFWFRTCFNMEYYIYIIIGFSGTAIPLGIVICFYIWYCKKACTPPKFEEVPVTGHPRGLSVIPVSINGLFLRSEPTALKLSEKASWTGDDCTITVMISVLRLCKFVICFIFNQLFVDLVFLLKMLYSITLVLLY